ncbi:hypothetical protein QFC22_003610 [Naganishia vaughanmartiniae]|uniref:Uncharacterized protein n=1 Tax=Naganishia vaughanmartiniae TaxID=1424756 RepID=A0ACC2X6T3_9TREE|nr:hypothetical protein QFC22_003610 [Naganishia vaughanmartiniae]
MEGDKQVSETDHIPVTSLPPDLYLPILDNIEDRSLLAKLCLIDGLFLELAREKLYDFVWVRPFSSAVSNFEREPRSGRIGAQIGPHPDIRYYPLAAGIIRWEECCVNALKNMVNLESITWTRNKTLRSSMLEAIASSPRLTKLEINGNSKWAYDPVLLNNLERLQELRIILPDRKVADNLKTLLQLRSESSPSSKAGDAISTSKRGLQVLELISQDSRWVNDQLLEDITPYLGNLRVFKLWGCAHIGPRGYLRVIRAAQDVLEELGLEGVGWGDELDLLDEDLYLERESPLTIDVYLKRLQHLSVSERAFHRLTLADKSRQEQANVMEAIQNTFGRTRLTRHQGNMNGEQPTDQPDASFDWTAVQRHSFYPRLGEHSFLPPTLSDIHISGNKHDGAGVLPGDTASHLVLSVAQMWKDHVKRFWLSNYLLTIKDLAVISEQLPMLDTLMLRMSESRKDPKWIAQYLARMPQLRVFHLQTSERRPEEEVYSMADLTTLAEHCGENLAQIGWANRVYHVRRRKVLIEPSEKEVRFKKRGWRECGKGWEQVTEVEERDDIYLEPWQAGTGTIPEIFQVWRA